MEMFLAVLVLLALIGVSNVLNRFVPFVPVPIIQVVLGIVAALLPTGIHLPLEPELFFVLFIAPLLFNDGKMTPRDELWKLRFPILMLALGLVFVTVFVGGYLIHWMIPSIPLAAAFALAAILSPTDAVAVSALAGRIKLPHSIMRLLEGEALMNDASGLVAFKFAIAAMVTGAFSLANATVSFILIAVGGLLCGVILGFVVVRLRMFIRKLGMEDATFHTLLQVLTPFAVYLIAEHAGVSGILAVVAAGIVHAAEKDYTKVVTAELQIVSGNAWSIILFVLNGLVFLILGLQIPHVAEAVIKDAAIDTMQAVFYIGVISIGLLALRFFYVFAFSRKQNDSLLTALSGVRGAVTLAGAFSIPYALENGSPFPQRSLIIFLAAGVILVTLVVASVMLPLIVRKEENDGAENEAQQEEAAKVRILQAGVRSVKEQTTEDNRAAAMSVLSDYERLIRSVRRDAPEYGVALPAGTVDTEVRMIGFKAEEAELVRLMEAGLIERDTAYKLQKTMKVLELAYTKRLAFRLMVPVLVVKQIAARLLGRFKQPPESELESMRTAKIQTCEAAIEAIQRKMCIDNERSSHNVTAHYREIIEKLRRSRIVPVKDDRFAKCKKELRYNAIQMERNEIQTLYEQGEISREIAGKLRRFVNYLEASMLEEEMV